MSVIIAVFLITLMLCLIGRDKCRSAKYESGINHINASAEEWRRTYLDWKLEEEIKRCIEDPKMHDTIYNEVFPILSQIENWGCLTKIKGQYHPGVDRAITIDIMMANRGKVRSWGEFGYRADNKGYEWKVSQFNYVETLLRLIQKKHPEAGLKYVGDPNPANRIYIWKGCHNDLGIRYMRGRVDFSKSAVFPENKIPPIEQSKEGR